MAHLGRKPVRVLVGIPSGDQCDTDFAISLFRMGVVFSENNPGAEIGSMNLRSSVLCASRNGIAQHAIDSGATHVLFLDSDMVFPGDLLDRLLKHDKDIVGVNYSRRTLPTVPTAFIDGHGPLYTEKDSAGLVPVTHCGMGAMLIKGHVFDGMKQPIFKFEDRPGNVDFVGEDVIFCRKAKEAGFQVLVDQDLSREIGHIGQWVYLPKHAVSSRGHVHVDKHLERA